MKIKRCAICKNKHKSRYTHIEDLDKYSYLYWFAGTFPQTENDTESFEYVCSDCYDRYDGLEIPTKKRGWHLEWGTDISRIIKETKDTEELNRIKEKIDKIDNPKRKQVLTELLNQKHEELNHAFYRKIILGVSILAGIIVVSILVSWGGKFKWGVKLMNCGVIGGGGRRQRKLTKPN